MGAAGRTGNDAVFIIGGQGSIFRAVAVLLCMLDRLSEAIYQVLTGTRFATLSVAAAERVEEPLRSVGAAKHGDGAVTNATQKKATSRVAARLEVSLPPQASRLAPIRRIAGRAASRLSPAASALDGNRVLAGFL